MSIRFRLYDATGKKGQQVCLALRKMDVGQRLLTALQSKDMAKSGGLSIHDLTRLDSGEMSVSSLPALGYSKAEISEAITKRINEIHSETDELRELERLLRDGTFGAAQGGREVALQRDWSNTATSPQKSLASANLTRDRRIEKSRGMGATSCADILTAHSWERSDGDKGTDIFTHAKLKHHSVHVSVPSEAWELKRGQKVLDSSERGDAPQIAAATLNSSLMTHFHRG